MHTAFVWAWWKKNSWKLDLHFFALKPFAHSIDWNQDRQPGAIFLYIKKIYIHIHYVFSAIFLLFSPGYTKELLVD